MKGSLLGSCCVPQHRNALLSIDRLPGKPLPYNSHLLRLDLIYGHFLDLLQVSDVHLATERREYPRPGEYLLANRQEQIDAGYRSFGNGCRAPLVRIYQGDWRVVRMAYCKGEKGRWLLLQYHGGASFSMLDLDLHPSDQYDLSTPDDIQRSLAAFDEETECVLEGLESHGIDRSNMIVSNSPGNEYCGRRVSGFILGGGDALSSRRRW